MEPKELEVYYRNFFPKDEIKRWITYGNEEIVPRRECGFFMTNSQFMRWQNINNFSHFAIEKDGRILERMEIGPIYSHNMTERQLVSSEFFPQYKELIFDLDADDFKDIKCCCGDSEICQRCWVYMTCAIDCLLEILEKNFGFKNILVVFSGRRGVHIWVCDKVALSLKGDVRESIGKYLNLKNLVEPSKKGNLDNYPLLNQVFPICDKYFEIIVEQQNIFSDPKTSKPAREILGDVLFNRIASKIKDGADIKNITTSNKDQKFVNTQEYKRLVIYYAFPRLDVNVTTGMVHLLKSPFSVHPKSGLISVPIPRRKYNQLPSTWVPSLKDLIRNDPEQVETFNQSKKDFSDFVDKCLKENKF